jgi:hypothetical protein
MMVILLQFVKKMDANLGEAHAALLTSKFAASFGCPALILEGDSLLTIVAIKDPLLFSGWAFAPIISDIKLQLLSISVCLALIEDIWMC